MIWLIVIIFFLRNVIVSNRKEMIIHNFDKKYKLSDTIAALFIETAAAIRKYKIMAIGAASNVKLPKSLLLFFQKIANSKTVKMLRKSCRGSNTGSLIPLKKNSGSKNRNT